jgi:hypothetical protein
MAKKGFGSFGNQNPKTNTSFNRFKFDSGSNYQVKPIKAEFGRSVPLSIYNYDQDAAWVRWRRGWELATSDIAHAAYTYDFKYLIPQTSGAIDEIGARSPVMSGSFKGFPTPNKELGMHWTGIIEAGNLRFDNLIDVSGVRLAVSGEAHPQTLFSGVSQDNARFWYIQLSGTFSTISGQQVPSPLLVTFSGGETAKPIVGDILEDKIITVSGEAIDKETRNPATNVRYGFVQAVLVGIDEYQGILQFEKRGSVQSTIDGVQVTPSRIPPHPGRFLQTGRRFCCTCQDFTRRDYAYMSTLGQRRGRNFPVTAPGATAPGRYEQLKRFGELTQAAQIKWTKYFVENNLFELVAPSGYALEEVTSGQVIKDIRLPANLYRDFPGIFADFGNIYTRGFGDNEENTSGIAESMPKYGNYKESGETIYELSDDWTFTLNQYRFCKHIQALRYMRGEFPIEPSDYPFATAEDLVTWEDNLVEKTTKDQQKAFENFTYYGMSHMDVPPFNVESPIMVSMTQKLFNFPAQFVQLQSFVMIDKNGQEYIPGSGEAPSTDGLIENF